MQVQFLHLVQRKRKSHSFLNAHDSQTVLVHGTNFITHVMATGKKQKKIIWAHVHWYNRSTRLVTVSGTHKHATPEAQEAVCIPKEPRHTKTL